MTFCELKSFIEMMRLLGYPRPISMYNFNTPNFELVSDILYWMIRRFATDAVVYEIETEDDRVAFLLSAAAVLVEKTSIRMNLKKLYAADNHAVKELFKVALILYRASQTKEEMYDDTSDSAIKNINIHKIKRLRKLSSVITEQGAKLYDHLENEVKERDERTKAMSFLDSLSQNLQDGPEYKHVEAELSQILERTKNDLMNIEKQYMKMNDDETAVQEKIKKKQIDLNRNTKRLEALQNIRPAFMDEYDELEEVLQTEHEMYVEKFRNRDYLTQQIEAATKIEAKHNAEVERSVKNMQKSMREEELKFFRDEDDESNSFSSQNQDFKIHLGNDKLASMEMENLQNIGRKMKNTESSVLTLTSQSRARNENLSLSGTIKNCSLDDDSSSGSSIMIESGGSTSNFSGGDDEDSTSSDF